MIPKFLKCVLMKKEGFWQKTDLRGMTVCIIRLICEEQKISKEVL